MLTHIAATILSSDKDYSPFGVPQAFLPILVVTPLVYFQRSYLDSITANQNAVTKNLTIQWSIGTLRNVTTQWTIIVYVVLALIVYCVCIACLIWTATVQGPETTRFPLIDFASRAIAKGRGETSLVSILNGAAGGN